MFRIEKDSKRNTSGCCETGRIYTLQPLRTMKSIQERGNGYYFTYGSLADNHQYSRYQKTESADLVAGTRRDTDIGRGCRTAIWRKRYSEGGTSRGYFAFFDNDHQERGIWRRDCDFIFGIHNGRWEKPDNVWNQSVFGGDVFFAAFGNEKSKKTYRDSFFTVSDGSMVFYGSVLKRNFCRRLKLRLGRDEI